MPRRNYHRLRPSQRDCALCLHIFCIVDMTVHIHRKMKHTCQLVVGGSYTERPPTLILTRCRVTSPQTPLLSDGALHNVRLAFVRAGLSRALLVGWASDILT